MTISPGFRLVLRISTLLALVVIYAPLMLVVVNSFNKSQSFAWPPTGFTLEWWRRAADSSGVREAVLTSVQVALLATAVALVLGTHGRDGAAALPVLRPRCRVAAHHPADRAPRHRDRYHLRSAG